MSVAQTSIENYHQHRDSGHLGNQQQQVLEGMRPATRFWSRQELAVALGLPLSSVCGRVNELVAAGLLIEGGPRPCGITGRNVKTFRRASVP